MKKLFRLEVSSTNYGSDGVANNGDEANANEHLVVNKADYSSNCISDRGRTLKRWSVRKVVGGIGAIVLIAAGVLYACHKDGKTAIQKNASDNMRVFDSMDKLFEEIDNLEAMNEQDLEAYENTIGFQSFGRTAESIYWQILKERGEELGYDCELGGEAMSDADVEFTAEDAQVYVSQYPEYLEIRSSVVEGGEKEYEFLPKYFLNRFRYVMNNDRMFQVDDNVFKVFKNAVIYTSVEDANVLYGVTEDNIENTINGILIHGAAGENGTISIFMQYAKKNKDSVVCTNCDIDPPTPTGPCGKIGGTYNRDYIETESPVAANNKERVLGMFMCESGNSLIYDKYWTLDAHVTIHAEWRGCKRCMWISCKRTLHTDFHMEIWYQDCDGTPKIHDYYSQYTSREPEKDYVRKALYKDIDLSQNATYTHIRPSIYNLCGDYWIATTSRHLNY